jgi:phospholipid/cholesterol/gamma-HCH transport system substrate-binding protein
MKRRDEVLVGLLLFVAIAAGLAGTLWLVRGGLSRGYDMYARFPWGAGLKVGQPVLLAGVNIGFVKQVALDPNGTLVVTLSVNDEYEVPVGTTAQVEPNGIFGDQLIALTPVRASTEYLPKGDTIPTGAGSPGVGELLAGADSLESDVMALTAEARRTFVDSGGIRELRGVVQDLAGLVASLTAVAEAQSAQLTETQAALRRTLAAVDSGVVDSTLRAVRATSANLAAVSGDLRETQAQLGRVLAKVDSGPGTAARLLNDPAVYARLDTLLARLDSLALDLRANPRRYINLRIF